MESIKELRELLQEEKVNPKGWSRPWGYVLFQRGPSIYITKFLIRTRVKPNHVTAASIIFGLAGCAAILYGAWQIKFAALGMLYAGLILDRVDGELARYKKIYSLRGIYWDEINHLVIPPLFWLALVFSISSLSIFKLNILFVAGSLGAVSLAVNRVVHSLAPQIFAKKVLKQKELFQFANAGEKQNHSRAVREIYSGIRVFFRFVHNFQDFFVIISATAIVIYIEHKIALDAVFHPYLNYFVFILSILFVLFAVENILRKSLSVDSDICSIERRDGRQV